LKVNIVTTARHAFTLANELAVPLALALTLLPAMLAAPAAAQSNRVRTDQVQAELISEVTRIAPYSGFWVGLRLKIKPGWHTYWSNPGDSGLATNIEWQLPEGMVAGAIRWPVPHRFAIGDLMNYGYADEVVLLTRMSAWPPVGEASTVMLAASASWLVCADICIPQEGRFELSLSTAGDGAAADTEARAVLGKYAGRLPEPGRGQARFRATARTIELQVPLPPEWPRQPSDIWFYPERFGVLQHAATQAATVDEKSLALTLTRGELKHEKLERLRGVLVLRYAAGDERGLSVDAEPG
jgi:thiol:disulfide interchange protein DsbD